MQHPHTPLGWLFPGTRIKNVRRRLPATFLAIVVAAGLAACQVTAPVLPRVTFAEPADGATVASPLTVRMTAQNFTIEPAGTVRDGAGHLHIMVDTACVAAGEVITKDDQHIHYGDGRTEAELELSPGTHTLCLQAADGAHRALPGAGMTHTITVTAQ